uniref:Uncharacterized protein n=1 Tax=Magnetococcus massalia (strain MO-1) TaxID=451514 RepID=A0A1S7LN68_MAGMO|nr:protein of unknown function [Candidatus Magnetococcus massalia]
MMNKLNHGASLAKKKRHKKGRYPTQPPQSKQAPIVTHGGLLIISVSLPFKDGAALQA